MFTNQLFAWLVWMTLRALMIKVANRAADIKNDNNTHTTWFRCITICPGWFLCIFFFLLAISVIASFVIFKKLLNVCCCWKSKLFEYVCVCVCEFVFIKMSIFVGEINIIIRKIEFERYTENHNHFIWTQRQCCFELVCLITVWRTPNPHTTTTTTKINWKHQSDSFLRAFGIITLNFLYW